MIVRMEGEVTMQSKVAEAFLAMYAIGARPVD